MLKSRHVTISLNCFYRQKVLPQQKHFCGYIWGHVGVPWFLALDFKRSRNPGTESVSVHRTDATRLRRLTKNKAVAVHWTSATKYESRDLALSVSSNAV